MKLSCLTLFGFAGACRSGSMKLSGHRDRRLHQGMTLIEIMTAVTLLTVIMVGLFAALLYTQRALKLSASQADVLEGGRGIMAMITRDLQEAAASGQPGVINLLAAVPSPSGAVDMVLPDNYVRTNIMQDFFMLTRKNDNWAGIGYFMTIRGEGIGSLYRYSTNVFHSPTNTDLSQLYKSFSLASTDSIGAGRVAEGIVHLSIRAFESTGQIMPTNGWTNVAYWNDGFAFTNNAMPGCVEVELGVIDPVVFKQYKNMGGNSNDIATSFLSKQAGRVHIFRQRVILRPQP